MGKKFAIRVSVNIEAAWLHPPVDKAADARRALLQEILNHHAKRFALSVEEILDGLLREMYGDLG